MERHLQIKEMEVKMKKIFLFLAIATVGAIAVSGCSGFRITNLPDQYRATKIDRGERTKVITTKKDGKVVSEVTTTDQWKRERVKTRPYRHYWYRYPWRYRYYR